MITIQSVQISLLIQFWTVWALRNPSKNEVHSEIDCAALATPGVMAFTEARGMMTMPSRVQLVSPEIFGVIQFGNDLYSLGMVIQFHGGKTYFIWRGCRKNKRTATGCSPKMNGCARTSETDF